MKQKLASTTLTQFEEFKDFEPQLDEIAGQSSDLIDPT